ncbi:hypothetical protein M3650_30615 [Paenibacillus sp. MER TA 81-3]|uniref:hypothetical protein n=1 Tax=Paenibacillus sp. MER TA 81-3 TaxID=2939573 RepID=UPI00203B0A6C|nr:hypothetical protein [Paenibacillus sp. MER TA 81-3]MCM3342862.1 hypothetical protein [Paenibacillus sp. MER TA 81-3]
MLKGMYPKKNYAFDKEVEVTHQYTDEKAELRDWITYRLKGKDFSAYLDKHGLVRDHISHIEIYFDKKELDPKLLKTATDAAKTAFNHKFEMKKSQLQGYFKRMKQGHKLIDATGRQGYDLCGSQYRKNK